MSNTLNFYIQDKKEIEQAAEFLLNNSINQKLTATNSNVHIYSNVDLEIVKNDNPDLIDFMTNNQGKGTLDVMDYCSSSEEDAGYEEREEIIEMQIKVFMALNEVVKMQYAAYSGGFDLRKSDTFSVEQIKRITNNGKLMSFTNMRRELYATVIEQIESEPLVITEKPIKKHSTTKLLAEVKANNEDYEWYPTTKKIIEVMYWDIKQQDLSFKKTSYRSQTYISMLDIGAGDGKVFRTLKEISDENPNVDTRENRNYTELRITKSYAIEKSQTLINSLDEEVFVIGTDFYEQTLIDKDVDVVFSNPPYSEFAKWSEKVIREANANTVYLVIPERWESDLGIAKAIDARGAEVTVLGDFDFLNAEDRKARAKVQLVKISYETFHKHSSYSEKSDPFEPWFKEYFKIDLDVKANDGYSSEYKKEKENRERVKNLVKGDSLIIKLEELYTQEMQKLMNNYSKVAELDGELLEELGVSLKGLKESLQLKIKGLKNLYWQELFDNLSTITSRLTSKSRTKLLDTLTSNTSVDFTATNAYSIVIWAIKNANKYYDSQLLELYFELSTSDNIRLYKSNKRLVEDGWRYSRDKMDRFALDYRIVVHHWDAISGNTGSGRNMGPVSRTQIEDTITIARNLGFKITTSESEIYWEAGKKNFFYYDTVSEDGEIKSELFMEVKAFKNGNLHFKFAPKFMKALNIEAARLNGWIKSPKEATQEFDITEDEAKELFGTNLVLEPAQMTNLLPSPKSEPIIDPGTYSDVEADENDLQDEEMEVVNNNFIDMENTENISALGEIYSDDERKIFLTGSLF